MAASTVTAREQRQIDQANASGRTPVVLIHGLWMLASCWDQWADLFESAGYAALTPDWPGDPETVAQARAHPQLLAGRRMAEIAEHAAAVIGQLDSKPIVIGHSLGGTLAQILAGRGLAASTVALAPAPFRGVLPLRPSVLRSIFPTVRNPANMNRALRPSFKHFRYAVANAMPEREASALYESSVVPGAGRLLFQAALANVNPMTDMKVRTREPQRGPMLLISAGRDRIAPTPIVKAAFRLQQRNPSATRLIDLPEQDHALTLDSKWREVAERVLAFVA